MRRQPQGGRGRSTGETSVVNSLTGLTAIREQVEQIASEMAELNERTRMFGSITLTVKDLADQGSR